MKLFTKSKSDEDKLIEGCLAGKREMQRLLYEQYSPQMMLVCLRYAPTTFEAEDIMQDAFVKVFNNIHTFKRDCPLEFWIRRIMVNTALKHIRNKQLLTVSHDAEEVTNLPSGEVNLTDYTMDELVSMIQSLAPRYRMVFNLYAIEGYNHKEIGEMLEISEGTSKSQYSRARAILQGMIARQDNLYKEHVISSKS